MNLRTLVVSALLLAAPAVASAQPSNYRTQPAYPGYYPPAQLPGGFHDRANRLTVGIGLGFGGMKSSDGAIDCASCDYNPVTAGVHGHIGYMMNPRLGLMLELQANGQVLEDNFAQTATLVQGAAMFAAQYWVTPQLWIKGGIGAASSAASATRSCRRATTRSTSRAGCSSAATRASTTRSRRARSASA
jgi:hypothetical protein